MKSAITISLVPEARGGPFVLHCGEGGPLSLAEGCRVAAELGFDGVEVFPSEAAGVPADELRELLESHRLSLAAVGTGAGWLRERLSLCDPEASVRGRAVEFIGDVIDVAGSLAAPAIIGSMQGRTSPKLPRESALAMLAEALGSLGDRAARHGQVLLYEPLNRYETDLFNSIVDAAAFLEKNSLTHVRILADLFHMNIEEADMAAAIGEAGRRVRHVHWADSNRRAIGLGHTDVRPLVAALRSIGFRGYLSAEVFPLPSPEEAAAASIQSFLAHASGK